MRANKATAVRHTTYTCKIPCSFDVHCTSAVILTLCTSRWKQHKHRTNTGQTEDKHRTIETLLLLPKIQRWQLLICSESLDGQTWLCKHRLTTIIIITKSTNKYYVHVHLRVKRILGTFAQNHKVLQFLLTWPLMKSSCFDDASLAERETADWTENGFISLWRCDVTITTHEAHINVRSYTL